MPARLSPFVYPRPERQAKVYKLTDPNLPGKKFEFNLAAHDEISKFTSLELAEAMILQYVGDEENDIEPVMDFPAVGGRPVKLVKTMCYTAASIWGLQMPGGPVEAYTFEELIAISLTCPDLYGQLQKLSITLAKQAKAAPKNDFADGEEMTFDSPSALLNAILK